MRSQSQAVFVIGLYHPRSMSGDGGITRSVRALSVSLRKAGYENQVIFEGPSSVDGDGLWHGIAHRKLGPLSAPVGLAEVLADVDVLVLHSAWVMHNVVAARVARRAGVPYVLAPRGAYDPMILNRRKSLKKIWWGLLERDLVENASAIHVFFESETSHIRAIGFGGPILVAPNGVQIPPGLAWDGGSSGTLLYVGRFDPEHKGLDVLLKAMTLIPPSQRARVILCGPDWRGGKEVTRKAVRELTLDNWVDVRPAVYGDEKWRLMISSRGFLYPSRWEAFGNSPAEAASLGVPLLTGDYPLGRYLKEHDAAVTTEATPQSVAEGLQQLTGPNAASMGDRARLAMEPFSWLAVAKSWGRQLTEITSAKT